MVLCNECKTELPQPQQGDKTTCPACGRTWELTSDHTAIKSVGLVVHNMAIDAANIFGGRNGKTHA